MVDVRSKRRTCAHDNCARLPKFNREGSKTAAYCKQHAEDGMVDVCHKRCSHDSCTKHPVFNVEGSKVAVYCKQHAGDGMVNVLSRRCLHELCTRRPSFMTKGSKTATYCKQHAEKGMVDVLTKRCSHETCEKTPLFNFEGIKTGAYCKQHARIGMIDVRSKRCSQESCMRRPNFNAEGSKIQVYCKEHAENGMVNVCSRGYSLTGSVRGTPGANAAAVCDQYSSDLLDDSATNLDALCAAKDCRQRPQWGLNGTQPTHCLEHAPLEEGVADTVGMDRSKGAILTSASRARTRLTDNADGTAAKRARLAIPRSVVPAADEHPSREAIKIEMSP